MQGYVPARGEAFADSRKCFGELEEWAASEEAAGLQHADLEEQLGVRGRELMRQLFQDRLSATAAAQERRDDVAGEDGVVRTRAERGRERPLMTKFGQVTVSRIAYRSPGRPNVHPADAALNLPEDKHSHGLRKLAAVEAARDSMEAACAAVTRATGVRIGKRQAEGLGGPGGRQQHADPGRHRGGRGTRRHGHNRHRLHPRVPNTCGRPPGPSPARASRHPRNGSPGRPARSCPARPARPRPGLAAALPPTATPTPERAGADECARYLENKQDYLDYATALAKG